MHIPDGCVSGTINLGLAVFSALACAYAIRKSSDELDEKRVPLMGVTSAFVFAAQMLNFPVAGGTSGHFLGAMLTSILLGPWNACIILAVVLITQCLGFNDGGLTALGTNIFNMGIIGGICSFGIFWISKTILPKSRFGFLVSVAICSWLSVVLASIVCSFELILSGYFPNIALFAMVSTHALIGIGEAIITVTVVSMLLEFRKDVVWAWNKYYKNNCNA